MKLFLLLFLSHFSIADTAYVSSVKEWRKKGEARLKAPDGWLSLIALHWLEPGATTFGTGKGNGLRLPAGSGPAKGGSFTRDGANVNLNASPGVLVNDAAPAANQALKTDASEKPDEVKAGRVSITVVDRSGRIGLRVSDPESPTRKRFKGRKWYPVREEYLVEAEFEPSSVDFVLHNVIGQTLHEKSTGFVSFEWKGKKYRLLAQGEPKEGLFIVFRDQSAGKGTYGAGRFLATDSFDGKKVQLDFNKAYNPPCAFTKFATCPLPPKENILDVALEAGEKDSRH